MKYILFFSCLFVASNCYANSFFDNYEPGIREVKQTVISCQNHFKNNDQQNSISLKVRQVYCFCMADAIRHYEEATQNYDNTYFNTDIYAYNVETCKNYAKMSENVPSNTMFQGSLSNFRVLSSKDYYAVYADCLQRVGESGIKTCECAADYMGWLYKQYGKDKLNQYSKTENFVAELNSNIVRCVNNGD